MTRTSLATLALALPMLAACDAVTGRLSSNASLLARAAGHELTIDEASELLASQSQLPNQPEVVQALADLWIDYTLLAVAASEDSTLGSVDLTPVIRQQREQELVFRLRDSQLQFDTIIPDDQLRELYLAELPGGRVRARHILLPFPENATPEQRDSVHAFAGELKDRLEAGADFAELAREYSSDRGSGERGGDLGFFGRGEMVRPFEEAAFSLEPGTISDPVESPYGVHVIRVEEREVPDFEDEKESFLTRIRSQRVFQTESIYIADLEERANVQVQEGAAEAVRGLASRPAAELTRRSGNRALTRYEGGAYTVFEFQEYLQSRPPAVRSQVSQATDEQIENLLENLTRGELLVNESSRVGIELSEDEEASMLDEARTRFRASASQLGLRSIQPRDGESMDEAVDRTVKDQLRGILQGTRDVIPLGAIAYSLRAMYHGETYDHNVADVLRQVDELRSVNPPTTAPPQAPRPTPADTVP